MVPNVLGSFNIFPNLKSSITRILDFRHPRPTHWAKMGLWIPFWWTSQNCILIILGHNWPFLIGKSPLRFSLKYIEMSEKLLWSWWKLEILENFKILFNTLIIICPYISLARICPWKSNLDQQKYIFFTNFWLLHQSAKAG